MNTEKSDAEIFAELMEQGDAAPSGAPAATEPPTAATNAPPAEGGHAAVTAPAEGGAGAPASTPSQDAQNVPEWLQAMPDEARQSWNELQAAHQQLQLGLSQERQARLAAEGRVVPLQRKLAQYELADHPRPAAPSPAATGGKPPNQQQLDSFYDSPSWKKFEAEFPEEAATQRSAMEWTAQQTLSRVEALEQRLTQQQNDPRLQQLGKRLEDEHLQGEIKVLAEEHPDWEQINQSQEFAEWLGEWRAQQPAELQGYYADDAKFRRACMEAKFASKLLHDFKRDAYIADLYLRSQPGGEQSGGAPNNPAPTPPAVPRQGSALLDLTRVPNVKGGAAPRKVDMSQLPQADQFDILFNG